MSIEESSSNGEIKPIQALAEGTIDSEVSTPYTYLPLRDREIRLLKLVPIGTPPLAAVDIEKEGEGSSIPNAEQRTAAYTRILNGRTLFHRLELIHVNLDEAPSYEPISYTWGDPSRQHTLLVGKRSSLQITKTLATCIPYFLKTTKTKHLWIDQLCINQEDNEEKGRQVAMMGDIYRKGQQTLVWLGEGDDDSDLLIEELKVRGLNDRVSSEFLWSITSDSRKRYLTSLQRDFGLNCSQHELSTPFPLKMPVDRGPGAAASQREEVLVCRDCIIPHTDKVKKAMYRFFTRPWFSRAWVTQETVLSKWNVFMISEQTLSTTDLEELPHILADLQLHEDFDRFCVSPGYRASHQIFSMRQDTPGTQGSEYMVISDLLNHFRETGIQATNPRDYVYSILGIHPRAGQIFTPDYDLSVRDLFISVTRKLIDESGYLHLLAHCDNVGRDFNHNLPSWVPDWTTKPRVKDTKPNIISAAPWPLKKPTYSSDAFSPRLAVYGKPLGSIRWIHPYDLDKSFGHLTQDQVRQTSPTILSVLDTIASDLTSQRPPNLPTLTKGTLLWDLDLAIGSLHTNPDGSEKIHWKYDGTSTPVTSLRIIVSKAAGRRFCIGEGAILGLVPEAAVAGDEVWILHGSLQQFVLRMVGEGEYLLVGSCIWDWRRGPHTYRAGPGWARFVEGEVRGFMLV